jgi:HEAT repeat protein
LKAPEDSVRWSAARELGEIGVAAKDAIPALIDTLQSQNGADRLAAASALGRIGTEAKVAVPALIATLQSQKGADLLAAASALGRIGTEAKAAIPPLTEALEASEDYEGLVHAAEAISQIGFSLQDRAATLTVKELESVIGGLEKAFKTLEKYRTVLDDKEDLIASVQRPP